MPGALFSDLRYALRGWRRNPALTAVVVLSLALGVGANTAIFSLIEAVMLRPLPVSHPEELLQVTTGRQEGYSNRTWEQLRDRQEVFSSIFAYGRWRMTLSIGGDARYVDGSFVSGQYFDTLGVRAAPGRTLTAADDSPGCAGAVVLTHAFWQRQYGGRSDVTGERILLDQQPLEIVGVTEPGFTGVDVGASVDVIVPLCAEPLLHGQTSVLDQRAAPWLRIIGRPKPGVPEPRVTAHLKTLAPDVFAASLPPDGWVLDLYRSRTFDVRSAANGLSYLRAQYDTALVILMLIAGVVLLIACVNVANLLLARGQQRQSEIAVRLALGSSRRRLIRQMLVESLLVSLLGAAVGVLFAHWGANLLVRALDVYLDLRLNTWVLGFTAGVAILSGLLAGIAPAWQGVRISPQTAMKANSRVIAGAAPGLGKLLVTAQVALAVWLVAGAGLMLSTFWNLTSLDPGFEPEQVLMTTVDIRHGHYTPELRVSVFGQMLEELRALPGVQSASISEVAPIGPQRWTEQVMVEGRLAGSYDGTKVYFNQVSDRYFETLGIAIVAGRDFRSGDTPNSPPVAIINDSMARKYFGMANPIGEHYRIRKRGQLGEPVQIVGRVKDTKYGALRDEFPPIVYTAWSQNGAPDPLTNFELRTVAGSPAALIEEGKSAIARVSGAASMEFSTLAVQIGESLERERLLATLSGFFGALALLLASVGLYGVTSYSVARRRNEIGIRMALGAEQNRVFRMVLGEVALMVFAGLLVGLGGVFVTARFLAGFLYGLTPNDPLTLTAAALVLAAVALLAGWIPARRASRLNPMVALRDE